MGFAAYSKEGVNYPILICNTCLMPIKDIRLAIITFNDLVGHPISYATGIYHKGECDPGSKMQPYSDELSSYLRQLICNVRLGEIIQREGKRQLVIEVPEEDDLIEVHGKLIW